MVSAEKEFLGEHLERVIVLEEPKVPVPVKAQAVRLYDDGVVVQWMFPGPNPEWAYEDDADEHSPEIELRDDLSTEYRASTGSSGGDGSFRGEKGFAPAVPGEAATLEILGLPYELQVSLK